MPHSLFNNTVNRPLDRQVFDDREHKEITGLSGK